MACEFRGSEGGLARWGDRGRGWAGTEMMTLVSKMIKYIKRKESKSLRATSLYYVNQRPLRRTGFGSIKNKIGHHISNHKGKNPLCTHTNTQN